MVGIAAGPGRATRPIPGARDGGRKSETQPFEITPDPRLHVTAAQLQQQFDLDMAIRGELRQVQAAILQIRTLDARLASMRQSVSAEKSGNGPGILRQADALERKATAVEDK